MATEADPLVGQWYSHLDKGQEFSVVAVDEDAGTVEIQHFDGAIEEVDLEDWYELDLDLIEPPEDWTGPVDDVERDDLGYTADEMKSEDWNAPLSDFNVETDTERLQKEGEQPQDDEESEAPPSEEER